MNNNSKLKKKKVEETLKRKETLSIFLIFIFAVLVLSSVFINPQIYQRSMHEGDIALKDFYAPYSFTYEWEIDEDKTQQARDNAFLAVPYYLRRDPAVENNVKANLGDFFIIMSEEDKRDIPLSEKINNLREKTAIEIADRSYKALMEYPDKETLQKETMQLAKNVYHTGFIDEVGWKILKKGKIDEVLIYGRDPGMEGERKTEDLLNQNNIQAAVGNYLREYFETERRINQAVSELAVAYLKPSVEVDEEKTKIEREAAAQKAPPVYQNWKVKKNEIIIAKGERVNARHIAQLSKLRSFLKEGRSKLFFMGTLLLFLLLGILGAIYMSFVQKKNFLSNTKEVAIVLLNMLFMIIVADAIIRMPQPSYFIPMASMGMMLILLIGFEVAFISVILMGVLLAVLTGGGIEVAAVLIMGSVVGMYAVKGARRRASILWAGLLAGITKFLAIVSAGLVNGIEMDVYLKDGLWGISSGLLSGVIVMGLLPVFEYLFKVPTNISLLELSDLNHPLLKRLALEAPGTYHHSIMVGNLAEAACDSIGANSLLARVGSYYHDIGKIPKPQYYSENEMGESSRHTGLTPSMSALIIAKHVKEGVDLANKYKLNNTIINFVRQHHGDSLIAYFYQKAVEKAREDAVLDEESFRYPGPKPQTKETAIVLLADSVEASSRALSEPTPASISHLVKKVINDKFLDGQLDECDLTLRDMHEIANAFIRVLMAVFHTRTTYPKEEGKTPNGKPNGKNKLRKQKPQKAD